MLFPLEKDLVGYQLYDFGHEWEIHHSRGVFRGTVQQVCTYAVIELGFEMEELETGISIIREEMYDGAEFGVLRRFIFPFDLEEKYGKVINIH